MNIKQGHKLKMMCITGAYNARFGGSTLKYVNLSLGFAGNRKVIFMKLSLRANPFRGLAVGVLSIILACGCFLPLVPAHAVTAAEMAAEANAALSRLHAMQETLDEASNNYFQALYEYEEAVQARQATEERITITTKRIEEVQSRLSTRARDMYRKGSTSFVDMLLGATTFTEFTQNWELLNRVNETDAELSVEAKELRGQLEEQKALLVEQEKTAQEKSTAAGKAFEDAKMLYEQMEATYNALSAEAQALYAAEQAAAYAGYTGGVQNSDGTVTDVTTGQTYGSASEYVAATGNAIVDRAYSKLGAGYQWGGTGANGYFDCSGFVSWALTGEYNRIGWTGTMINWNPVADPQPGDVCVIHQENGSQHTGIYIGNGQMIHAADEDTGVIVGKVQDGMIYVRP